MKLQVVSEVGISYPRRPSNKMVFMSIPIAASFSPCTARISAFTRATRAASNPFKCSLGLYEGSSSLRTCMQIEYYMVNVDKR